MEQVSATIIAHTAWVTFIRRIKNLSGPLLVLLFLTLNPAGCKKVIEQTGTVGVCPIVITTDPADTEKNVVLNKVIKATFNEVMDSATITTTTFTLQQGGTMISGTVTYSGTTASFIPAANLSPNTIYTATITASVKDLARNSPLSNYVWTFTTLPTAILVSPSPSLGSASIFGTFGGNAGATNQGLNTIINNGGIGTTAAPTLITGFHDGMTAAIYTETPLNKGNATGGIYTAPPFPGTATSFSIATIALADANNTYDSISPASKPGGTDPGAGELGGLTLAPGIYKSASGTFKITNANLTLDAMGDPNAIWIFQTAAALTVGIAGPTGARSVIMKNGALPKNVYWYVGSAATINGAGGGVMVGNIIASAGITFSTAGNVVQTVLNGRAISLNASVTMVNTTINVP
jgi:Ice-binding-like/Bacterial Ig-like domain